MHYKLENLSEDDFEKMINMLCQRVLGTGTVSFTKGRDGGRDGRFEGTANDYPSKNEPWSGKFIIQAKHTNDYNASCSDNPFFGNQTSIINKEITKINELIANKEIDNYLLFTNRKETESREKIRIHIKNETGLNNVDVIGTDTIGTWLDLRRDLVKLFNLGGSIMPFDFYDKDIKEVIVMFYNNFPKDNINDLPTLDRPSIYDKNIINNLDKAYYDNILEPDMNRYHNQILDFLQNPINYEYTQYYEETSQDLKRLIETHKEDLGLQEFKKVFAYLTSYILEKDINKMKKYRNMIAVFFHFMYYQCDIGREK